MNFAKNRPATRATSMKSQQDDDETSFVGSNGSYFDSEEESDYQPTSKRLRTIKKNGNESGILRKPTRVPDLKISNRNALLARENRKRKKEMMETLEQTVSGLQNENKRLQKMMKFKDGRNEKLIKEVQYLKSVIANRTEIVSVLKSLPQFSAKDQQKSVKKQNPVKKEEIKSTASSDIDTLSCETYDNDDNGSKITVDVFFPSFSDDFLFQTDFITTNWDEILENPFSSATDFSDIPKLDDNVSILTPSASPISSEISTTDHNYSNYDKELGDDITSEEGNAPGVCIHVRNGRVSLEFCSVCHFNATSSWIENIN